MSVCLSISHTSIHSFFCFFLFPDDNLVNINGFSPNLVCALILWRSGLGLLIGKFRQMFSEFSARDTIMLGYYSLTFDYVHYLTDFSPQLMECMNVLHTISYGLKSVR